MNLNQFTIKAREAIQQAQEVAAAHQHQAVENIHVLKALFLVDDHLVPAILQKLGLQVDVFVQALDRKLASMPKVSGGEQYFSTEASKSMQKAVGLLTGFNDSYVSIEHLLLAVFDGSGTASLLLKDHNINRKDLVEAIQQLRKGATVSSQSAEQQYDALNRYAKNLNDLAREGKLDPVIGRDEEIRRVLQIFRAAPRTTQY
jgi:ATP-dependent Clp protease ATP-binding subunit ClpB